MLQDLPVLGWRLGPTDRIALGLEIKPSSVLSLSEPKGGAALFTAKYATGNPASNPASSEKLPQFDPH